MSQFSKTLALAAIGIIGATYLIARPGGLLGHPGGPEVITAEPVEPVKSAAASLPEPATDDPSSTDPEIAIDEAQPDPGAGAPASVPESGGMDTPADHEPEPPSQ